ncbi:MAG TPA: cupin domain-containing protein [Candidatus Paceibacterota bacterium]|nr:cupin domain-containing protein [Verrucomicrobiota bacterium]HRY48550.1 cupin domain-containing protein [Candidatus Paceibacterota bacterium]HRZ57217.1 cupin domain-containing protein [Candidatus Paceibacterota bacterium]
MIRRYYQNGQKLDVAGLNVVTVLVDRSETQLTEVGWNRWRKGLEGPPHSHEAKEQIFFVTDGEGIVVVGPSRYAVKTGSLIYVPPKAIHQTIVTGDAPLSYFLFNAFLDAGKEGHASFADHIEKVREVRRQQAQFRQAAVPGADTSAISDQPGKHIEDVHQGRLFDFGSNTTRLILERNEAVRAEVTLVSWPKGSKGAMVSHPEKEQTFFVLSGRGKITVGEETLPVAVGDVVFVPWQAPHTTEAADETLTYLCLNTHVIETKP